MISFVELEQLLRSEEWSSDDWIVINQLSKKLDMNAIEGDTRWRSVCASVLCRAYNAQRDLNGRSPLVLKRLNVAHKAIGYLAADAAEEASKIAETLETASFSFVAKTVTTTPVESTTASDSASKILPLTVLFSEGPIARAYLETIASLGYRPRKIVHLVSAVDVATGKENLRWLPTALRKPIAASMQRSRIFHWPNAIAKQYSDAVFAIVNTVTTSFDFAEETIRQALVNKPLIEYSDSVDTVLIRNLRDPALFTYVSNESDKEFLYTGGGIVPARLLAVPESQFIHVHPGFLPDIRGGDGLLWSILANACPSASAFYMAPGIDTGDVISARWLPPIHIELGEDVDLLTRYRMAYAFVDPWVRCRVLRELIANNSTFGDIASTAQSEMDGITYHFMHDHLRALALDKLFGSA